MGKPADKANREEVDMKTQMNRMTIIQVFLTIINELRGFILNLKEWDLKRIEFWDQRCSLICLVQFS